MPVWNQLEVTKDCINSIRENTSCQFRFIVIDNASDAPTRQYLQNIKEIKGNPVTVIRNENNLGFVKAVNQGIAVSDAPYVCILNNDTMVTRNWLEEMISIAELDKTIGIVNPSSNNLGQRPEEGEPLESFAARLRKQSRYFIELGAAIGFCMLIKREVIVKVGNFDEVYGMGNFEDTDFSRKAIKEGYKCVRACGAYVYHRENSSFNKLKTFEDDFKRNKEIYEFRWGKPKRIAYILNHYDEKALKALNLESIKMARGGNWVWYLSTEPVELPAHSNIRLMQVTKKWFYPKVVFTILKKKKRFDEIFVDDKKMMNILSKISFIHKAKIDYY